MVTGVPIGPEVGERLVMIGAGNVKAIPLLVWPPTVTVTLPLLVAGGATVTMLVEFQLVDPAGVPLKLTALVPCVAPKFVPMMVTVVPAGPEVGEKLVMFGAVLACVIVVTILE
jgi:hypothetical protein